MGLSSGEKQQAICARGSEANAEHVTVGRLSRLELYKAVTVEGSCERKRDWKKKPRDLEEEYMSSILVSFFRLTHNYLN